MASKLSLLTPLFLLGNADYLKALDPHQLQALASVAIRADAYGFGVGLIFVGAACLVVGHLIYGSGFLPRVLGVLMGIAGLCYLTNSFALTVAPAFADLISPAILLPAFIAELSFCFWLIIKGVDVDRWRQRNSISSWGPRSKGGFVRGEPAGERTAFALRAPAEARSLRRKGFCRRCGPS